MRCSALFVVDVFVDVDVFGVCAAAAQRVVDVTFERLCSVGAIRGAVVKQHRLL